MDEPEKEFARPILDVWGRLAHESNLGMNSANSAELYSARNGQSGAILNAIGRRRGLRPASYRQRQDYEREPC